MICSSFRVDQKALDEGYRRVELQVHPDRFASATPAMKRVAEQWSQRANEALSTLSDPLKRAVYLCESAGFPVNAENNTRMPVDFLMQQMEWREKFEAGKKSPLCRRRRQRSWTVSQPFSMMSRAPKKRFLKSAA